MKKNGRPLVMYIIFLLVLTQWACLMGEIMDANPPGYKPDHIGTLTAQVTRQEQVVETSTLTPSVTTTSTNSDEDKITGTWTGTAQWKCNDNPVWNMTMNFQSNGTVSITLSGPGETTSAEGKWVLQENQIRIQLQTNFWYGTVTENNIRGSFEEDDCSGVWFAQKK